MSLTHSLKAVCRLQRTRSTKLQKLQYFELRLSRNLASSSCVGNALRMIPGKLPPGFEKLRNMLRLPTVDSC